MPKIIELSGVVGIDITAKNLKSRLPKNGDEAVLKVDSIGGSVYEGNRLENAVNDYVKKFPGALSVEFGAIAASAASYPFLGVGAKNIKVRSNTVFMGHKAWTIALGNADDMKQEAEILDGFDKMIAKAYSKVNGKPTEENLSDMGNEFWLMGGQAVIDAGFASEIVEHEEETEEVEIVDQSEVKAMIEESKVKLRDIEDSEDLNKWAAKINEALNVDEDGHKLLFNSKTDPSGSENNSMEDYMDLKDYLDKNPEAKVEYENSLKTAGEDRVKNAVEEDRKRTAEILALSGMKLTDNLKASIESGESLGDFAIKERKAELAVIEAAGDGGQKDGLNAAAQTQTPKSESTKEDIKAADEKSVSDYLASQKKGAK